MNKNFAHLLDLLWEMTIKELKVRYKNTSLGFLWVIIYPIIQAAIIGYVFHFLYKINDPNYQYSLFLNLLIWNFFSSSIENATPSIVRSRGIIKKAKFPYMVIPLSIVLSNGIHMFFTLILFTIFINVFAITSGINIFMLALGCVLLLLFTGSLSLITSALNVSRRDIGFLAHASLMIWFYATPVVYTIANIPENISYLWNLNPLTEIVMFFQSALLGTPITSSFIMINTLLVAVCIFLGIFIFQSRKDYFDDYV